MTKKLEEEFNLPSMDEATVKENAEATDKFDVTDVTAVDIEDVQKSYEHFFSPESDAGKIAVVHN